MNLVNVEGRLSKWRLQKGDLYRREPLHPKHIWLSRFFLRIPRPDLAWRSGAMLERLGAKAEVMELVGERDVIRIRVRGDDPMLCKELLVVVAEEFDKLHDSFSNLKVEKLIPCICGKCQSEPEPIFYEFNKLLKRKQAAQRKMNCDNSYQDVDVLSLLNGVGAQTIEEDFRKEGMPGRIQRQAATTTNIISDNRSKVKDLIANNYITEAINLLKTELNNNDIFLLENQWNELLRRERLTTISYADSTTRRNQITDALMSLTEQVGKP